LKTTDAIAADFPAVASIEPKLEAFEALLKQQLRETVTV
jgi:hypothetical protein